MLTRLRQAARRLRREVSALYLATRDPRTPRLARWLAIAVVAYALSPIDLIPDTIPVFGLLDDLILVPLGIALVLKLMPADLMAEFRQQAEAGEGLPRSRTAAVVIVGLWLLALAATLHWLVLPLM